MCHDKRRRIAAEHLPDITDNGIAGNALDPFMNDYCGGILIEEFIQALFEIGNKADLGFDQRLNGILNQFCFGII